MARYLAKYPRLVQKFVRQTAPTKFDVCTDSDHAGCARTRKSSTCTIQKHGQHVIKTSSTTQGPIALSSPESEYYGIVKGMSGGTGLQAMARDLGEEKGLEVHTDASSGKAIAQRRGLGRVRHISTRFLWVQQKLARKEAALTKIPGKQNPAELGAKHLSGTEIKKILDALHMYRTASTLEGALSIT